MTCRAYSLEEGPGHFREEGGSHMGYGTSLARPSGYIREAVHLKCKKLTLLLKKKRLILNTTLKINKRRLDQTRPSHSPALEWAGRTPTGVLFPEDPTWVSRSARSCRLSHTATAAHTQLHSVLGKQWTGQEMWLLGLFTV